MPVEFHCTRCSRLLRTPEGSGGRQTQCPECGEVLIVPTAAASPSPFANAPTQEANPYQSPSAATEAEPAAPGELSPTSIELGDVLTRSWEIFKSQLGMIVLGVFLAGVLTNAPQWLTNIVIQVATLAQADTAIVIALQIVLSLATWAFQIWVTFGELAYLLHIARGGRPEISMLFSGSRYFVPGVLATLLFMLMNLPAALVCLGPAGVVYAVTGDEDQALIAFLIGIPFFALVAMWLWLTFSYYQLAIVDRQCGPLESLAMSRRFTSGNKLTLFALLLTFLVINIGGLLACCVGIIFTGAYSMLAVFSVAWLCMTGQPTGDQYLYSTAASPIAQIPSPEAPPLAEPKSEDQPLGGLPG